MKCVSLTAWLVGFEVGRATDVSTQWDTHREHDIIVKDGQPNIMVMPELMAEI